MSKVLVDNDRVQIQRLSVPAGFREALQVAPNDQIAIQVTPGDLEVVISGKKTVGRIEPGTTFYVLRTRRISSSTWARRRTMSSS